MNERPRTGKENISEAAAKTAALIFQKELTRRTFGISSPEYGSSRQESLESFLALKPIDRAIADAEAHRRLIAALRQIKGE